MAARAMGWLWLAHAAAAVVAFAWLGVELVRIIVRFDLARDGLAQIGAFFAGYGMFVAATIAVFGWKLGRFALGRAAGSALAFFAGAVVLHLMPTTLAYLGTFGPAPPPLARCLVGQCLERPWQAVVLFESILALATLGWLATVRRAV